jgi:NAD(P)H-nitrite reductase large subunit
MRYDAVLHYADEEHSNYRRFHLPSAMLEDPEDEEVTLAELQQLSQRNIRLHDPTTATPSLTMMMILTSTNKTHFLTMTKKNKTTSQPTKYHIAATIENTSPTA